MLAYNTEKLKSLFYPGDYVIRTGDREIHPLFGRLPDNPEELAYMGCATGTLKPLLYIRPCVADFAIL